MSVSPRAGYLLVVEAAQQLQLTVQRIRQLCNEGTFAILPVDDRTYLVSKASVDAYSRHRPRRGPRPGTRYQKLRSTLQ